MPDYVWKDFSGIADLENVAYYPTTLVFSDEVYYNWFNRPNPPFTSNRTYLASDNHVEGRNWGTNPPVIQVLTTNFGWRQYTFFGSAILPNSPFAWGCQGEFTVGGVAAIIPQASQWRILGSNNIPGLFDNSFVLTLGFGPDNPEFTAPCGSSGSPSTDLAGYGSEEITVYGITSTASLAGRGRSYAQVIG